MAFGVLTLGLAASPAAGGDLIEPFDDGLSSGFELVAEVAFERGRDGTPSRTAFVLGVIVDPRGSTQ